MNNQFFMDKLEEEICNYTGAKYCVLTDSCTNAIFLSLMYLKKNAYVPSEFEITIPKNTYIGVAQSIKNANFNIQFSNDLWRGSYNLIGTNVYDCAVDFHQNMYLQGTIQCLSFQQKKRLNIGKGGAILLDDLKTYNHLKAMAFDGRTKNDNDIQQGWHMNMDPETAAKGLLILNQIELRPDIQGSYKDYRDLSKIKYFNGFKGEV